MLGRSWASAVAVGKLLGEITMPSGGEVAKRRVAQSATAAGLKLEAKTDRAARIYILSQLRQVLV
jgi:hypothetical protein